MTMEWGGWGGHGAETGRLLGVRQEVWARGDQRGEGTWGDHEKTLLFVGRLVGQVRLYGERGRGRGGRQRRSPRSLRGIKSVEDTSGCNGGMAKTH